MMNTASNLIEKTLRGDKNPASISTDTANPANNPEKWADPSMEKMKALAWMKAGDVQMGKIHLTTVTRITYSP